MIVSTERLGMPGPSAAWLERKGILKKSPTYDVGASEPTATCHLQASASQPALCGYQWEGLVEVPGNPAWADIDPIWRCSECSAEMQQAGEPPNDAGRQWTEQDLPVVAANRAERERLLVGKGDLVTAIEDLLFASDPIGINFETNTDEYRPEAQTITLRLSEAATVDDLHRIVHEEFVRWFGDAGPKERYAAIAREIWTLADLSAEG